MDEAQEFKELLRKYIDGVYNIYRAAEILFKLSEEAVDFADKYRAKILAANPSDYFIESLEEYCASFELEREYIEWYETQEKEGFNGLV